MSVFEPHLDPESYGASQLPALDVPLRGRKGQQVAAYIQELAGRLDQQSARAEQAERAAVHLKRELQAIRNQPPPSFEHLGSEAAKVLEEAGRSAKVLVEEAKDRGREIIQKAEDAGQRVRARADHDAEARLEAARQAAEQMIAKANAERSAVDAETKRLRHYRDSLLSHLGRVQTDLAGFLADVDDAPPLPPTAQGPSPAAVPAPRGPAPAASAEAGPTSPAAPAAPAGPAGSVAPAGPAGPPVPRPLATPAPPSPAGQLLPPERSPGERSRSEPEDEEARDGKAQPSAEAKPDNEPGPPKHPAESAIASARAPE